MTSMRERMARAVAAKYFDYPKSLTDQCWAELEDGARKVWLGLVDAVLDVLMEPTPQVLAAIDTELHPSWLGHRAYELIIQAIKDGK